MKKYLFALATAMCTFTVLHAQTCCMLKSNKHDFTSLTARQDFQDAHLAPEPFLYTSENGQSVTFTTPDGKTANAFAVKAAKKTKNVIIMVHEWWGLNDYIKKEAEKLQRELVDVDVYAVDLYDGQVASDPQTAAKLMGGLSAERASNIVKGLINLVGKDVNIATIGWCMGGSWSFQAALLAGNQTKACVMYYGFPEKDVEKMKTLASDILYIQGTKDAFIKNEDVDNFVKNLESVNKKITVKQFDADHAFANPSNPKFSKEFAENAHRAALTYIRKALNL
jgi:carboxymethylenebutenolidase